MNLPDDMYKEHAEFLDENRVPKGGFAHRMMPPVSWTPGEIPQACYDESKSSREIEIELSKSYLAPENIQRLVDFMKWQADTGEPAQLEFSARMQLEILAEIDAKTIWACNIGRDGLRG